MRANRFLLGSFLLVILGYAVPGYAQMGSGMGGGMSGGMGGGMGGDGVGGGVPPTVASWSVVALDDETLPTPMERGISEVTARACTWTKSSGGQYRCDTDDPLQLVYFYLGPGIPARLQAIAWANRKE